MTMLATAPFDRTSPRAAGGALHLSTRVFDDLAAVEPTWRGLETQAITTPYQRFDWIAAYLAAGFEPDADRAYVVLYDHGEPIALLPLTVKTRLGLRMTQIIGMPISNVDGLVFDPAHADRITPEAIRTMFAALADAGHPTDVVSFHCLSKDWAGIANPLLAFPHALAPNRLYVESLEPFNPQGKYALPKHRRKNIRYSRRKLEDEFGPLRLVQAQTPEEVVVIEEAFLAQRARRFAVMGVENIFAKPEFRRFFIDLATSQIGERRPAMALHALYAGDTVLATSIGTFANTHYSHYMNSTTDGDAARYSIIGVLLTMLLDQLRSEGIASFDIGLGDFDYKYDWSTPIDVYDCLVPLTVRGHLAVPALSAARRAKRLVKQTPALWRAARKVQSALMGWRNKRDARARTP